MGAFSTLIQFVDTDPKQSELMSHLKAAKAGNVEETEGKDLFQIETFPECRILQGRKGAAQHNCSAGAQLDQ